MSRWWIGLCFFIFILNFNQVFAATKVDEKKVKVVYAWLQEYNKEQATANIAGISRAKFETHQYRSWLCFLQWRIAYTKLTDEEKTVFINKYKPYYIHYHHFEKKVAVKETFNFSNIEEFFKYEYCEVDYMSAFSIFPQRDKIERYYYQELIKRGFIIVKLQ